MKNLILLFTCIYYLGCSCNECEPASKSYIMKKVPKIKQETYIIENDSCKLVESDFEVIKAEQTCFGKSCLVKMGAICRNNVSAKRISIKRVRYKIAEQLVNGIARYPYFFADTAFVVSNPDVLTWKDSIILPACIPSSYKLGIIYKVQNYYKYHILYSIDSIEYILPPPHDKLGEPMDSLLLLEKNLQYIQTEYQVPQ